MARGLRVVGGSARGRRLVAPKSDARPTTDRVKEALFNVLAARVVDAVVLDLYAGSGALGIEALSRGAARAVFVDDDRAAVDAIRANLETTGFADSARVVRSSVGAFLARRVERESGFDLVLADPPYDTPTSEIEGVLTMLAGSNWVHRGGAVVVERARAGEAPALPPGWGTGFQRAYGDTLLLVATF